MKKVLKIILAIVLFIFIAIQFYQPALNVDKGQVYTTDFTQFYKMPVQIKAMFQTSCYDCHSNNTNYPWYANIQPMGWLLANHIKDGKAELNFNEFGSYSQRRQQSKLKSIVSQIKDDEMPLASYTMLHKNAKLTKEQKALIIDWALNAKDSLEQK